MGDPQAQDPPPPACHSLISARRPAPTMQTWAVHSPCHVDQPHGLLPLQLDQAQSRRSPVHH